MRKTGFVYHPFYLKHDTRNHPENFGRLQAIQKKIQGSDIYSGLVKLKPRKATKAEIALIHDLGYIEQVEQSCREGLHSLDLDTNICSDSYEAALLSAGAGIVAVNRVLEDTCDNVFCAVRPPGHHAEHARSMGFCLFNNVAIAAK